MNDVPSQGARIGPILRERRETLGLSLEDAENTIHIRVQYLVALETDAWHNLPGEIVGRGFLQNYADFLQLDAQELKERRQEAVDVALGQAWNNISAGTQMPSPRGLDYRPMTVRMSGEAFEAWSDSRTRRTRLLTSLVLLVGLALVVAGVWQGVASRGNRTELEESSAGVLSFSATLGRFFQTRADAVMDMLTGSSELPPATADDPTATPVLAVEVDQVQATPTLTENATPVPTHVPAPTPTFTPEPAALGLVPADCPNEWVRIVSPLEGQVISGEVQILGTAFHADPDLWYYKLERSEGDRVFLYFAGQQSTVENGVLGTLDTRFMANGVHTIRLTVVDVSSPPDPPVCDLEVTVQN